MLEVKGAAPTSAVQQQLPDRPGKGRTPAASLVVRHCHASPYQNSLIGLAWLTDGRAVVDNNAGPALKRQRKEEDGGAGSGPAGGTISVEGFAVTWCREAVYYLPMAELRADPGCCALLSHVLQSPTTEKASLGSCFRFKAMLG